MITSSSLELGGRNSGSDPPPPPERPERAGGRRSLGAVIAHLRAPRGGPRLGQSEPSFNLAETGRDEAASSASDGLFLPDVLQGYQIGQHNDDSQENCQNHEQYGHGPLDENDLTALTPKPAISTAAKSTAGSRTQKETSTGVDQNESFSFAFIGFDAAPQPDPTTTTTTTEKMSGHHPNDDFNPALYGFSANEPSGADNACYATTAAGYSSYDQQCQAIDAGQRNKLASQVSNSSIDHQLYLKLMSDELPRLDALEATAPTIQLGDGNGKEAEASTVICLDAATSENLANIDLTQPIGSYNPANDTFANIDSHSTLNSPISSAMESPMHQQQQQAASVLASMSYYDCAGSSYMHTPSNTSDDYGHVRGTPRRQAYSQKATKKSFSQLIVEGITESHAESAKSSKLASPASTSHRGLSQKKTEPKTRKGLADSSESSSSDSDEPIVQHVPRRRGRPRKSKKFVLDSDDDSDSAAAIKKAPARQQLVAKEPDQTEPPVRTGKRGRPRRHKIKERDREPSGRRSSTVCLSKALYNKIKHRMADEHSTSEDDVTKSAAINSMMFIDSAPAAVAAAAQADPVVANEEAKLMLSSQEDQEQRNLSAHFNEMFAAALNPEESFRNMPNPFASYADPAGDAVEAAAAADKADEPAPETEPVKAGDRETDKTDCCLGVDDVEPLRVEAPAPITETDALVNMETTTETKNTVQEETQNPEMASPEYTSAAEAEAIESSQSETKKRRRSSYDDSMSASSSKSDLQESKKTKVDVGLDSCPFLAEGAKFRLTDPKTCFVDDSRIVLDDIFATNSQEDSHEPAPVDFTVEEAADSDQVKYSSLPSSEESDESDRLQEQQRRQVTPPTKSSIMITKRPVSQYQIPHEAHFPAIKASQSEPKTFRKMSESKQSPYYLRVTTRKVTRNIVQTILYTTKHICDRRTDTVLRNKKLSTKKGNRVISETSETKYRSLGPIFPHDPRSMRRFLSDEVEYPLDDELLELDDYDPDLGLDDTQPAILDVDMDYGADDNLSSIEYSSYELDDFIGRDEEPMPKAKSSSTPHPVSQAKKAPVSASQRPAHVSSSLQTSTSKASSSSQPISLRMLNDEPEPEPIKERGRRKKSGRFHKRSKQEPSPRKVNKSHRHQEAEAPRSRSHKSHERPEKDRSRSKSAGKDKSKPAEDEARASKSAVSSGRSTRRSGRPLSPLVELNDRKQSRQVAAKTPKKYKETPIISFTDLKIKLTPREAKKDQQDLHTLTKLHAFSASTTTPEKSKNKSSAASAEHQQHLATPEKFVNTSNNVQLRNAFNLSSEDDANKSSAVLKYASSSSIPLYTTTPLEPTANENGYQAAMAQAIQGIEAYENEFEEQHVHLATPAVIMQAAEAEPAPPVFPGYDCGGGEMEQLVELPNDLVENEITIPFQEPLEEVVGVYESYSSGSADAETPITPAQDEDELQSMRSGRGRGRRRKNAPLAEFAKSLVRRRQQPKKTTTTTASNEEQLRRKFNIKECSIALCRMDEIEFRRELNKYRPSSSAAAAVAAGEEQQMASSPEDSIRSTGKRFVRNVKAHHRTKSPRNRSTPPRAGSQLGSSSSVMATPNSVEELERSSSSLFTTGEIESSKSSESLARAAGPSCRMDFTVGEYVFALHADGHFHPAVVVSVSNVYGVDGSSYVVYSCGFTESADKLMDLEEARTDNLRQYDLLKLDWLAPRDKLFIKEGSGRRCKLTSAELINRSLNPSTRANESPTYSFVVQTMDNGQRKVLKLPFESVVVPRNQPSAKSTPRGSSFTRERLGSSDRYVCRSQTSKFTSRQSMEDSRTPQQKSRVNTLKWTRTSSSSAFSSSAEQP